MKQAIPQTQVSIKQVVEEIERINAEIANFWSNPKGWAPERARDVLATSRLDWQVSLSATLHIWISKLEAQLSPGELILAWANLGSLLEGTMKTLLVVYYDDYIKDVENIKKAGAFNNKKNLPHNPDRLRLEQLKIYFREQNLLTNEELNLIDLVQKNRNVVHAFMNVPLGSAAELQIALRNYLSLLDGVNGRLPYPHNF
jgi:hypothetical protein